MGAFNNKYCSLPPPLLSMTHFLLWRDDSWIFLKSWSIVEHQFPDGYFPLCNTPSSQIQCPKQNSSASLTNKLLISPFWWNAVSFQVCWAVFEPPLILPYSIPYLQSVSHQVPSVLHHVPYICPFSSWPFPPPSFWIHNFTPKAMACSHIGLLPSPSGFSDQPAYHSQAKLPEAQFWQHSSPAQKPSVIINKSSVFTEDFLWSSLNLPFWVCLYLIIYDINGCFNQIHLLFICL